MLKLATLIQNPGEPPVDSRYADPRELAELGYTGQVLYSTTALSGVASPDARARRSARASDASAWRSCRCCSASAAADADSSTEAGCGCCGGGGGTGGAG
mgnify:CR=1 FL=1